MYDFDKDALEREGTIALSLLKPKNNATEPSDEPSPSGADISDDGELNSPVSSSDK